MSEQFSLDFENPEAALLALWAEREAAEAAKWTPEQRARVWAGFSEDLWLDLPNYQRRAITLDYEVAQAMRRGPGVHQMDSYAWVCARHDEHYKESEKLAQSWVPLLQRAFRDGTPCPIKANREYEHILSWAMDLAQLKTSNFSSENQQPGSTGESNQTNATR